MYGLCHIGMEFEFKGIIISPNSSANHFISKNVTGNKSLYSCSNYVIISTV
jgi:hypothetical protein